MASGGWRRRRSREEDKDKDGPGLGTLFAVGAVATGVAALTYGAKKLYDYVTEEARAEAAKLPAETSSAPSPPPPPRENRESTTRGGHHRQNVVSLSDRLHSYYTNYVTISADTLHDAQQIVDEVRDVVTDALQQHSALGPSVSTLTSFGSASEGLMVIAPTDFDFFIPLNLDAEVWQIREEGGHSGFLRVQRIDQKAPLGSNPYDQYLTDRDLTPRNVTRAMVEVLKGIKSQRYNFGLSVDGSVISLGVRDRLQRVHVPLTLKLYPALCLRGALVCGRHPPVSRDPHIWQECFAVREAHKLRSLDPENCCHLQCLQIVKALRLNHQVQFGFLPSYVYKTILLHMIEDTPDEEFWRHHCLQEQFIDLLNQLIYYLQGRHLPCFFNREINLLEGVPHSHCDNLVNFITKRIGKENLHTLLLDQHRPEPVELSTNA